MAIVIDIYIYNFYSIVSLVCLALISFDGIKVTSGQVQQYYFDCNIVRLIP